MSYVKNTWANGDVITAAKLNNMEDGIEEAQGGGGIEYDLVIKLNYHHLSSVTSATLISGTYAACETKALNQEPLNVLVYGVSPINPDYPFTITYGIISCYLDNYHYNEEENCVVIVVSEENSTDSRLDILRVFVYSDDVETSGHGYISISHQ